MRYTTEEGGRLNNYAIEPKMYQAEPPSDNQKKIYAISGAAAIALVVGLCVIAAFVS